jgi:3-oxoacyl-[acyl-carrier protein] reductase
VCQINQLGSENETRAIKVQIDVAHASAPKTIVDATCAAFGPSIDILVNNAGVTIKKPFLDMTPEDFDCIMNVNLRGVYFLSQAVVPHLRRPGRIINISSTLSRTAGPEYTAYSASKAALEGFTRGLASVIGTHGHSVNAVLPGMTQTDMLEQAMADEKLTGLFDGIKAATPMEGKIAKPEDIAAVVVFLAQEQSQWITGQSISASGGLVMI